MQKESRVSLDFGAGIVLSVEPCAHPGCWNAGSLSQGLRGNGPWYCAEHFRFESPPVKLTPPIPEELVRQVCREIPRDGDPTGKWWARRILRWVELGQKMPSRSVELANEVLGLEVEREPGQEG